MLPSPWLILHSSVANCSLMYVKNVISISVNTNKSPLCFNFDALLTTENHDRHKLTDHLNVRLVCKQI